MFVEVSKGDGNNPADMIVDPLCVTPAVCIKRGESFLNEQEIRGDVTIEVPFSGTVPGIGSLVNVITFENRVEVMRVAGWSFSRIGDESTAESVIRIDLNRRSGWEESY